MRDHWRRRSVCRGCTRGSNNSSTCANAEDFSIPNAAGKMIQSAGAIAQQAAENNLPLRGPDLFSTGRLMCASYLPTILPRDQITTGAA
jgi:hypothetical protein